jgi:hypothetical protein
LSNSGAKHLLQMGTMVILTALLLCPAGRAAAAMCLQLHNQSQNKTIGCWPIMPGQRFSFMYVHSVQKTPVYEDYMLDPTGRVLLVETRVQSFGYGMPKPVQGENYELKDGFYVIRFDGRNVGKLLIRVNFIREMKITLEDREVDLRRIGQAGDLIRIQGVVTK